MDDRYQNQPWYVKLWRRRYTLSAPFHALRYWKNMRGKLLAPEIPDSREWEFRDAWKLAIGSAHAKMKWYYTIDEVKERLHSRLEKRRRSRNSTDIS